MSNIEYPTTRTVELGKDELSNIANIIASNKSITDISTLYELEKVNKQLEEISRSLMKEVEYPDEYVKIKDLFIMQRRGLKVDFKFNYPNISTLGTIVIDYQNDDYRDHLTDLALEKLNSSKINKLYLLIVLTEEQLNGAISYFSTLAHFIHDRDIFEVEFRIRGMVDKGDYIKFDRQARRFPPTLKDEYNDVVFITGSESLVYNNSWNQQIKTVKEKIFYRDIKRSLLTTSFGDYTPSTTKIFDIGDKTITRIEDLNTLTNVDKKRIKILAGNYISFRKYKDYGEVLNDVKLIIITHGIRHSEWMDGISPFLMGVFHTLHNLFNNASILVERPPTEYEDFSLPEYVYFLDNEDEKTKLPSPARNPYIKDTLCEAENIFDTLRLVVPLIQILKKIELNGVIINVKSKENEENINKVLLDLLSLLIRYNIVSSLPYVELTVTLDDNQALFYSKITSNIPQKSGAYRLLFVNPDYFDSSMIDDIRRKLNVYDVQFIQ